MRIVALIFLEVFLSKPKCDFLLGFSVVNQVFFVYRLLKTTRVQIDRRLGILLAIPSSIENCFGPIILQLCPRPQQPCLEFKGP
jgi:hypothetical protein